MTRAIPAVVLLVAACAGIPGFGAALERDGTTLRIAAPAQVEAGDPHGWLCPTQPTGSPLSGPEGEERLRTAGCLDLGSGEVDDTTGQWRAEVNLESMSSAQIQAFADLDTYRLLVVVGTPGVESVWSVDVPPVDLNP